MYHDLLGVISSRVNRDGRSEARMSRGGVSSVSLMFEVFAFEEGREGVSDGLEGGEKVSK